jgi:hypothetical protein
MKSLRSGEYATMREDGYHVHVGTTLQAMAVLNDLVLELLD